MSDASFRRRLAGYAPGAAAFGLAVLVTGGVALSVSTPHAAADPVALPMPAMAGPSSGGLQTVVLSGGCFWGVQGVFEHVRGVTSAVSGYAGGGAATARYEVVSTGLTGHAESVRVTFDPARISYGQILQVFFSVALDPTELNRQGPDSGSQYRSEVFATDAAQADIARRYIAALDASHAFAAPIATRVDPLSVFYPAEGYHQDYLVRHPDSGYIETFDMPKLDALRRLFPALYTPTPTLTAPNSSAS